MFFCTKFRASWFIAVIAGLLPGVSGCRHKPMLLPLPQITQPVDLLDIPEPDYPNVVEVPEIRLPAVPTASAYSKLKLKRRKQAPPVIAVTPPAPPISSEAAAAAEVARIGSLSSGGDTSPRAQQEASELIMANERRINGLSPQKAEAENSQLSKVKNFQKQAQDALSSGDTEGAKTLATKAKLVLDDIDKL